MRKVTVISRRDWTGQVIRGQLRGLLRGLVDVDYVSIEQGIASLIDADLVVVSNATIVRNIGRFLQDSTHVLTMKRTIAKASWGQVMDIPPGTRVLVVNDQRESTDETMTLIHELGANHLELVPYYPGAPLPDDLPLVAVTPNEAHHVPPGVPTIVNVGERVLDGYTIIDILTKLDMFNAPTIRQMISFIEATIPISPKLFGTLHSVMESKHHLELVLEVMGEGIVAYDDVGNILIINGFAEKIFQTTSWKARGTPLRDFFTGDLAELPDSESMEDVTCTLGGDKYIVNKYPLYLNGHYMGGVIRFREHTEIERLEQKIRRESLRHGYTAKYTFDSIIGQGPGIASARMLAAKMARGNAPVLIEGDSGVGKELFAQAIHNASPRRRHPFVAFNCASVPDSLIESELFGYEDGAFTGARKGGKPGLFELAHQGTVFLDEIGDISQSLQAKLLRVLQEKEIVRVGGNLVKTIDIRVLAASNRDLEELVRQGRFRKDLYYRINTLLLRLPPLKERREDIIPLLEHYLGLYGVNRSISEDARRVLQAHLWPGNVRELRNCATFIVNMSEKPVIAVEDLPPGITGPARTGEDSSGTGEGALAAETRAILNVIHRSRQEGRAIGRGGITRELRGVGVLLTELEVRGRLRTLALDGLLVSGRGRAGVRLTRAGQHYLETIP